MSESKTEKSHAGRRPVETIAFERDLLPEFKPGTPPSTRPKAVMPRVHNPKFAIFARAQAYHRWVTGQELTDAEFDAAVKVSEGQVYR